MAALGIFFNVVGELVKILHWQFNNDGSAIQVSQYLYWELYFG